MKRIFSLVFPAIVVLVSGCATTQTPLTDASPVPSERVYVSPQPKGPAATVIFVRDSGMLGSGVYQHLSIDGQKVASLDVGEKVSFRVAAGSHLLGVVPTDPFGAAAEYVIDQQLEADQTYLYRVLTDGNSFSTRIQRAYAVTAR